MERQQREYEEQLALMGSATGSGKEEENLKSEPTNSTGASWYFYNPTSVSKGITEFTRKWGMRKNEDNWRISDQRSLAAALSGSGDDDEALTEAKNAKAKQDSLNASYTNHDRGYYLQDLPFTMVE